MKYTIKAVLVITAAAAVLLAFYPFASTATALAPAIIFATCFSSRAAFLERRSSTRVLIAGAKSGFISAIAYGGLFAIYELWSKWRHFNFPNTTDDFFWYVSRTISVLVEVSVVFGGLALIAGAIVGVVIAQLALLFRRAFPIDAASGEPRHM